MADRETSVRYRALGDFASLARSTRTAKRNIDDLRKSEERLNATTAAGERSSASAVGQHTAAREKLATAADKGAGAVQRSTVRFLENARAARSSADATQSNATAQEQLANSTQKTEFATRRQRIEAERLAAGMGKSETATRRQRREQERFQATVKQSVDGVSKFQQGLNRLQNWRPRLTPPFIQLIPLLAGALGLINPLVAGVGALSAAGFGLATSLGSVAGVLATGFIPGIATAIGLVAALRSAFGGIGGAFKAFGQARNAAGGGGGGGASSRPIEITQTEKLARAQEDLARATQDVTFAQEDLNEARGGYVQRLKELQRAVDRAAMSEARAAANSQLARENYANVLADPGSTKGQKMDAAAGVKEAGAEYTDTVQENKKNQADLLEMQRRGMAQDRQVIQAQRGLTDAINRQRDAQIALANAQRGTNEAVGGGAAAMDEYQRLLDKLSPSARKFVEYIVGMTEEWEALQRATQESFFSEVVDDLDLLRKYLPPVQSMLTSIAGAAGRVFSRLLNRTTSPQWLADIVTFGNQAAPVIETIGDGLLDLLDAFRDLTIASMPFLQDLAEMFRDTSKEFSIFVANGRKSGSIAAWLEKGRQRLEQWSRIVGNIAKTLVNYGGASEDFANWVTDGLEQMTEGWLASSEAAKQAGSPFQDYLEDIRPLLSEVSGLIGDFFGWFSEEAMDPDNINQMLDIFQTLREDVGPALKSIFDSLSEAEIGPGLVEVIGKLIDFVAAVLEGGGADALAGFFDLVGNMLEALTDFAKTPAGNATLTALGATLAALAAMSFIGQFTGLTNLLGLILKFGKGGGIGTLGAIAKLLGVTGGGTTVVPGGGSGGGGGRHGSGTTIIGGSPDGGGRHGAPKAGGWKGAGRGGLALLGLDFLLDLGKGASKPGGAAAAKGAAGAAGGAAKGAGSWLGRLGGAAARGGAGGPIGIVAGLLGAVTGGAIADTAPGGKTGSAQRVGGNALAGAASGAGIGAAVGSVVPGIGTGIGAAVGGVVGAGVGLFTSSEEDRDTFFDDTNKMVTDFFTKTIPDAAANVWEGLVGFGEWLGEQWDNAVLWFQDLPYNVGVAIGTIWAEVQNFGDWLAEQWNNAVEWFESLPENVAETAGEIWSQIQAIGEWLGGTVWPAFQKWVQGLPKRIADAAGNLWKNIQGIGKWLRETVWPGFTSWIGGLPKQIGNAAGNIWKSIQGIGGWLGTQWNTLYNWVMGIPGRIGKSVGDFFGWMFGNTVSGASAGYNNTRKKPGYRGGQVTQRGVMQAFAGGGAVRGARSNVDNIPAMLTAGEVVVRKQVVDKVGMRNLLDFNRGVLSYQDLMLRAMANSNQNKKKGFTGGGSGLSFFYGGGVAGDSEFKAPPPGGGATPPPSAFSGAPGSGNGDMNFGDINIYNPVAETSSESIPRAIRRTASLGAFRKEGTGS